MDSYKKIVDKMDSASMEDILPGFDKNEVWQELQPQLSKRKRLFAGYHAYAATIIGILLILGAYLLWPVQEDVIVTKSIKTPQPEMKQGKSIDTPLPSAADAVLPAPVATEAENQKTQRNNTRQKPVVVKVVPQEESNSVTPQQVVVQQVPVTEVAAETANVVVPKRRIRAIHLSDVDEEMKSLVIKNPAPQNFGNKVVYFISGDHKPEKEDNAPAGVRSLLKN